MATAGRVETACERLGIAIELETDSLFVQDPSGEPGPDGVVVASWGESVVGTRAPGTSLARAINSKERRAIGHGEFIFGPQSRPEALATCILEARDWVTGLPEDGPRTVCTAVERLPSPGAVDVSLPHWNIGRHPTSEDGPWVQTTIDVPVDGLLGVTGLRRFLATDGHQAAIWTAAEALMGEQRQSEGPATRLHSILTFAHWQGALSTLHMLLESDSACDDFPALAATDAFDAWARCHRKAAWGVLPRCAAGDPLRCAPETDRDHFAAELKRMTPEELGASIVTVLRRGVETWATGCQGAWAAALLADLRIPDTGTLVQAAATFYAQEFLPGRSTRPPGRYPGEAPGQLGDRVDLTVPAGSVAGTQVLPRMKCGFDTDASPDVTRLCLAVELREHPLFAGAIGVAFRGDRIDLGDALRRDMEEAYGPWHKLWDA